MSWTSPYIVAVFETWPGGKSALYCASEDGQEAVDRFIEAHHESGSFARLHTFDNEQEAWISWEDYDN